MQEPSESCRCGARQLESAFELALEQPAEGKDERFDFYMINPIRALLSRQSRKPPVMR